MPVTTQSVVIVPATSSALTTKEAVKTELGITGTEDDAFLDSAIRQASSAISTYCNYVFGVETLRDTFRSDGYRGWREGDHGLILAKMPVVSVISVTSDGTPYVVDTHYYVEPAAGMVFRLVGGAREYWDFTTGIVEYTAGYVLPGQPSPTLPEVVERACIDLVKMAVANRARDPQLRSEQIMDIVTRTWYPTTSETSGGLPSAVAASLDYFRMTVIP